MKTAKRLIASLFVAVGLSCVLPACGTITEDTAITDYIASAKAQLESGDVSGFVSNLETQLKAVLEKIPASERATAEAAIRSGVKAVCESMVSNGKITQSQEDSVLSGYDKAVVKIESAAAQAHAAEVSKTAMRK